MKQTNSLYTQEDFSYFNMHITDTPDQRVIEPHLQVRLTFNKTL